MNKRLSSSLALVLIATAFLTFALFNNAVFSGLKLDLTEHGLYTLTDGSREVIEAVDEPVNLYFFFSQRASEDYTALRAYAQRVQELLARYESLSDGRIILHVIDPEPFSEEEDRAAAFGLQAVPVTSGNDLYFGLAATNSVDDQEVIAFFQPDKEAFLEYEISRLVQTLSKPDRPVVGLMTELPMAGDINMQTFQPSPAWVVVDQLGSLFDIENIEMTATVIPEHIDTLVIVHPKGLGDDTLRAIDQFAMAGGRILAFVDPLAEIDQPQQANPMMPAAAAQASDLNRLTDAWGVTLLDGKVLGDSQAALQVGGPSGRPVRHLAILGLGAANLAAEDVVTASLENINVASAGVLEIADDATATVETLLSSSEFAMPLDAMQLSMMSNPEDLQQGFSPTGQKYPVAVRLSGHARSAFTPADDEPDRLLETSELNVILVADVDIISDRLWVQVQNFFGQRIASPFANNGDFMINAVDNLAGSSALISVRSRGRFTRPFTVVQDLRREAEARYLASANDLQAELSETEQKLTQLEAEREENNLLSLTPEQEAAIDEFQQEKVRIRKQLRDVRHQLDRDIEALGSWLKFLNIFLLPLLLTLMLLMMNFLRLKREGESNET